MPSDKRAQSKQSTSLGACLTEAGNTPASETSCFFKKLDDVKKKIISVNLIHDLFSHLSAHDDLVMPAMIWLHVVWFRVMGFGTTLHI